MEPTSQRTRAVSPAHAHLERGFRFEQGGRSEHALESYREALAAARSPEEEIEARMRIARVYRNQAQFEKSIEEAQAVARLAAERGLDDLAAEAMNIEVGVLQIRGEFEAAEVIGLAALDRAKSPRIRGVTLQNLGRGTAERGDFERSDRYFDESLAAFREAQYEIGLAVALTNAARAALDRGDAERSVEIGHEAIQLSRRLNALDTLLTAAQNQAAAFVVLGNLEPAEALLTEALGHFTSTRSTLRQAECLEIMGQMTEKRPDLETAARCYARARDLALAAGDQKLADRLTKRIEAVEALRLGA